MYNLSSVFTNSFSAGWKTWGQKGGWAVLDQGIFSGANFILNILLARWLSSESYGAFAVGFTILLLVGAVHNAFILEPLSVFGPSKYASVIVEYSRKTIRLHFLFTASFGAISLIAGIVLIYLGLDSPLPYAIFGMGISLPVILLIWHVRRISYLLQEPFLSFQSSAIYGVLLLSGVLILRESKFFNVFTIFIWMGVSASIGTFLFTLKRIFRRGTRQLIFLDIVGNHLSFGKWIALATVLTFVSGHIQIFIVAGEIGLEGAGVLRAMNNFFLPMSHIINAISSLGLSSFARDFTKGDYVSMRNKGLMISIILFLMSLVFELLIILFTVPVGWIVYQNKYINYNGLTIFMGFIPIFTALSAGPMLILRAIQKPAIFPMIGFITAIVGVTTGFMLTKKWGITGTAFSMVAASAAQLVVTYYHYNKWLKVTQRR